MYALCAPVLYYVRIGDVIQRHWLTHIYKRIVICYFPTSTPGLSPLINDKLALNVAYGKHHNGKFN